MKKLRILSLLTALVLVFSIIEITPVHAAGEWANVYLKQGGILHPKGCTVCTLQLILQNSDTLKPEYQLPPGQVTSRSWRDNSTYDKFDLACAPGISQDVLSNKTSDNVVPAAMSTTAGKVCKDGVTWTHYAGESSVEGTALRNASGLVVAVGGVDLHSMSHEQVISAMKLFWNAGYWVAIGITYTSGGSQLGPGPSGYKSDHWVMLSGVDDTNFYINDPAFAKGGGYYNNSSWPKYDKVQHLAIYKNNQTSPLSLSGGQRANLNAGDYSNLEQMGISRSLADSVSPSLDMSWSNDVLLTRCKLTEANLEELLNHTTIGEMTQDDLEVLEGWRTNVDMEKNESGFISVLRWVTVLVGILLLLWAILVYLAFWFDHINSFVYLDMLHIITLGQLHICPPNEKPTFKMGSEVKNRTVSHGQILCICGVAVLFGAGLVSGVFYVLVARLVNFVLSFLSS